MLNKPWTRNMGNCRNIGAKMDTLSIHKITPTTLYIAVGLFASQYEINGFAIFVGNIIKPYIFEKQLRTMCGWKLCSAKQ